MNGIENTIVMPPTMTTMKNVDEMTTTERHFTRPQPLLPRNCCGTCPGFHSTKTNPSRCDFCNCDINVHTHTIVLARVERRVSRKPLRYGVDVAILKPSKCDNKKEAKEEAENAAKVLSVLQDNSGAQVNTQHAINIARDYDDACGPPPLRLLNAQHATKKRAAEAQMAKRRRRLLSDPNGQNAVDIVSCRPLADDRAVQFNGSKTVVSLLSDNVVDVEGDRD